MWERERDNKRGRNEEREKEMKKVRETERKREIYKKEREEIYKKKKLKKGRKKVIKGLKLPSCILKYCKNDPEKKVVVVIYKKNVFF